jgi:hypothetical protein
MKKIIIPLIVLIMLIALLPLVSASICTVSGYVKYADGSSVPDRTQVTVKNLNTLIAYPDATGGNWPFRNYYSISFSCSLGIDEAVVSVGSYEKQVSLDQTETIVDLTLPWQTAPQIPLADCSPDSTK